METFQYCRQSLKLQNDPIKTRRCIFINSVIGTVAIVLLGIVLMNLKFTLSTSLLLSIPLGIVSFITIALQQYSNRKYDTNKREKKYEKILAELELVHPEMLAEDRVKLAELKSQAT